MFLFLVFKKLHNYLVIGSSILVNERFFDFFFNFLKKFELKCNFFFDRVELMCI